MNACDLSFCGLRLRALGSGALFWPEAGVLCVSDLHLGKSERMARRGGAALPPYETRDTLTRLAADLDATGARVVVCLGDSFDDLGAAAALPEAERLWITRLQAGRRWVWIEGNHDAGPVDLGGAHLAELAMAPLTFRHIALAGAVGEISGHYHPKAVIRTRARAISRPAFLADRDRIVMPAYGTYTGGLRCDDAALAGLMRPDAVAVLTGAVPHMVPMPR
ncbi:ligase-associated DNA damage response endonuclease PdeM [Seohaeicola zhoushanensis]|uniref:Metallophosphoesterase n=1 Tax=Seohaeicola zhoushanensis TaxID=1569283 RepID=A0A8J3GW20_9RHOB|nr:ligase-associated DNA damage response endonuclease PdeM [Seohaeicola zhoushanensis]GHF42444.1 metallophosphoesterase [Seohaeicola zhoushanensis]